MNIVGQTIFLIVAIGIGYAITTEIILQEDNDMKYMIPRFVIGTVVFGLFMSLPTFIYIRTLRITKQHLIKELGLKANK